MKQFVIPIGVAGSVLTVAFALAWTLVPRTPPLLEMPATVTTYITDKCNCYKSLDEFECSMQRKEG